MTPLARWLACTLALALAACPLAHAQDAARSEHAEAATRPVVVFAAASLKNALDRIASDWEKTSGRKATLSFAASSALAKQIDSGAPADLFLSADLKWMDWLAAHPEQYHSLMPATTQWRARNQSSHLTLKMDSLRA